jgi:hypothetical protein
MPTELMKDNMIKVNFMIIGAARSATTSLCNILATHPDVCFSSIKEPQFFSNDNWRDHIEQYHALFKKTASVYGEGSTNYTKYPFFNVSIPADIYEYNPDMKFIYMMRHPVDRMVSHYKFAVERGYTNKEIDLELNSNEIYIETSKYYSQIKRYIDQFGKDNIKLVLFNDFINDQKKIMQEVVDFIGIPSYESFSNLAHANKSWTGVIGHKKYDAPKSFFDKINKAVHIFSRRLRTRPNLEKAALSSETKKKIINELEQDIHLLEKLMNKDLSSWLK